MTDEAESYAGWAVLELMGHRRLAGLVSEAKVGGATFIRIDVPGEGDEVEATQFYAPGALYCLTPTTEEIARSVARFARPQPVQRWELPRPDDEEPDVDEAEMVVDNASGICVACSEDDHDSCTYSWSDDAGEDRPCVCACEGPA